MRGAVLTQSSELFPFGISEVGIRCTGDDLFAWVTAVRRFDETLIALPAGHREAEAALADRLTRVHRFRPENAAATAKHLFDEAFSAARKESGSIGDTLCPEES